MAIFIICLMRYVDLNFNKLKPCGISDFTASTASDAVPHSSLQRNDIFLVSAANLKLAQFTSNTNPSLSQRSHPDECPKMLIIVAQMGYVIKGSGDADMNGNLLVV